MQLTRDRVALLVHGPKEKQANQASGAIDDVTVPRLICFVNVLLCLLRRHDVNVRCEVNVDCRLEKKSKGSRNVNKDETSCHPLSTNLAQWRMPIRTGRSRLRCHRKRL